MDKREAKAEAYILAAQMLRSNLETGPDFGPDGRDNKVMYAAFGDIINGLQSRAIALQIGKRRKRNMP